MIRRIFKESARGFAPTKAEVRAIANKLLEERGGNPVGKNQVNNFVKRTPKLRTRQSRPYNHQRAAYKDLVAIQRQFDLVQATRQKWGIVDDDIYNFNKTSFIIGKILLQILIIALKGYRKKKQIQLGNYKQVAII